MSKKYEFQVEMTCDGCSGAVQRVLGKVEAVKKTEIDMEKQRVYVESDLSHDDILAHIKKTGKACSYVGEV